MSARSRTSRRSSSARSPRARRFEQQRCQAGVDRARRHRQRAADERRRHLRRAARGAQGRRADRGAGPDGQPAVRVGHPGRGQRRADDSARRGRHGARRRDREHEPGAARHPRPAQRPQARPGRARGLAVGGADRLPTAAARWRRPPRTARPSTASPASEQDEYALRSQQLADRAWTEGRFADEVVPVEVKTRKGVETGLPGRPHAARTRPRRGWRSCRPPSRRTAA